MWYNVWIPQGIPFRQYCFPKEKFQKALSIFLSRLRKRFRGMDYHSLPFWIYQRKTLSTLWFVYMIKTSAINICNDFFMFERLVANDIFHIPPGTKRKDLFVWCPDLGVGFFSNRRLFFLVKRVLQMVKRCVRFSSEGSRGTQILSLQLFPFKLWNALKTTHYQIEMMIN